MSKQKENEPKVAPEESLSRFIVDKSYFRSSDGTVRHNAFMPNNNQEVSIFRTSDISENEKWDIGRAEFAEKRQKKLLGRADILSQIIYYHLLCVIPDPYSHPLHANIIGFPDEKACHRSIAVELASDADLIMCDT